MLLSTYCKDLIILWFVHFLSNNEGSFISVCGSLPIFRSTSHTRPSITIRRTGGSVGRRRRSICLRLNKISDQFRPPPFDVQRPMPSCVVARWRECGRSAARRGNYIFRNYSSCARRGQKPKNDYSIKGYYTLRAMRWWCWWWIAMGAILIISRFCLILIAGCYWWFSRGGERLDWLDMWEGGGKYR